MTTLPPKPPSRPDRVSLWRHLRLFRHDILSSQPERLYRAWMAEFRTPFFRSYLCNDPALIDRVLKESPDDFPKSGRITSGLRPLLGQSVFVTNGERWRRQRRLIDPAFEGGRLRDTFPSMLAAGRAAVARLIAACPGDTDIEEAASHLAADIIFRALFSLPIEDALAAEVYARFRAFQRAQPVLSLRAFLPLPDWLPLPRRRRVQAEAQALRVLIRRLTDARLAAIASGTAPDDLATKILTARDPETGRGFNADEMVDQVAIFFLAGHETSAAALAWALYLCATHPDVQTRVAAEAQDALVDASDMSVLSRLPLARDVFRETLRLYAPVPMMVREARCPVRFRDRNVERGSQIVLSPWYLGRHTRIWDDPDAFRPERWRSEAGRTQARLGWLPFSAGPRVCTGAGFAMAEGTLMLSMILRDLAVGLAQGPPPVPVAHLTVRSKDGIRLNLRARRNTDAGSP
jgi:cytochrome P450